ncbi:DUF2272 domain-containing protein [Wielerella bovis]|uniref:DUF2272 domain-containing protein n=1 Tax=Wielerella bovis TaxID=2917790 RepID=UPI002019A6F1|nr:DUF2272 domain-containing protein [Wielerella bovis]ULJ62426.1 DUF2272 domain-containing protein [Wielerella bovis]ULJ64652.1 DUF2272 domain-containing protein [Wielerella bovis]ULJ66924.1 DUF2272 domain-containing protein [Wielerella bovis]
MVRTAHPTQVFRQPENISPIKSKHNLNTMLPNPFKFYALILIALLTLNACQISPHTAYLHQQENIAFPENFSLNQKITWVAKREHELWHRPFINQQGHIVKRGVSEATHAKLSNGQTAWQRVALYWATPNMDTLENLSSCFQSQERHIHHCRSLLLDKPWSAAFISHVMTQAGAKDFVLAPAHITYIRAAAQQQGHYQLLPPTQTRPEVGDLLCYSRSENVKNHAALKDFLQQQQGFLPTHCDVVVDVYEREVHLIGGNVADTVMLRKMPLDKNQFIVLPDDMQGVCQVENETACNANRQHWVALLKLW